jgi:hypothetical protein
MGAKKICISMVACGVVALPLTGYAAVGSVISSFEVSVVESPMWKLDIYRDADYLYLLSYDPEYSDAWLERYTLPGCQRTSVSLEWPQYYVPARVDHSVLGSGYAVVTSRTELFTFSTTTGSFIGSQTMAYGRYRYAYIPGSPYIYTGEGRSVYRLTTSGQLISSFQVIGELCAATGSFMDQAGEYIITEHNYSPRHDYVYSSGGSLLASFNVQEISLLELHVCGPGYPPSHGTTYWRYRGIANGRGCIYQLDLGNTTTNVVPASLGRIKAIYE